jgi:tetratricopeptide (TPR) repeat protein
MYRSRSRMMTHVVMALLLGAAGSASAQSAAQHVALGDKDRDARNPTAALKHYEAALALDSTNYDALRNAAYECVDLGEFDTNAEHRGALYRSAEQYARRAVAANPRDADGHFQLAQALGRNALTMGVRDKIKLASEIRNEALAALAIDPKHSGALHVMGVWNAEIMRLNGFSRAIARRFLGASIFDAANWNDAQKYLEGAVAADSTRIVHRLDLAAVYADRDQRAKAIEQYEWIARAPVTDYNDPSYKTDAMRRLTALR